MALSKSRPFNHYQLQLIFVGGEESILSWCQAKNTWFEDSKFGIVEILELSYLFAHGHTRYKDLAWETSIKHSTTSMQTITDWVNYCRETCFAIVDETMKDDFQIGGPEKRVEVDETKIGKRKYNIGRLVEGSWILGMVELNDNVDGQRLKGGRLRLETLKDRSEETL
ncbi:unnamed protein product, partial [Allacma fusca]